MIRALEIAALTVTTIFLSVVVGLVITERTWRTDEPTTPAGYFLRGSTGTELMPLPVFQVLPGLFPDNFQPAGKMAGDWIDQFGFVRGQPGVNQGLPLGVSVTHYRPKSGAPSPVAFIGFNCAVCHTGTIRRSPGDSGVLVYGMGNAALDLVAFGDAIKSSLLDEKRLTVAAIDSAYSATYHTSIGPIDKIMIALWLQGAREALRADVPMRDWPFGGTDLRNSSLLTGGPGRNEPMKETVRFLIDRTPTPDGGASEIPSLYRQDRRLWAQYDGSVRDPLTRNSLAALGVGASIQNLRVPGILHTLQQSYAYVKGLEGPSYAEVFKGLPVTIDTVRAARGHQVYLRYCTDCHGAPGSAPGQWTAGRRQGDVVPVAEIGTDGSRLTFRYYDELAGLIYDFFPNGHPLQPQRADLRPTHGYINSPIESVFSRAPYLHNGSVATLAELINLKPRRTLFYRGLSLYDPAGVGLSVPAQPDATDYFAFDTRAFGNSNRGHDYPWGYRATGWNRAALEDLLEYLKTL